jgi:hypothetical protein
MEEKIWAFLLDNEEWFLEIPSEVYLRLVNKDDSRAFPHLGGKFLLLAIVHIRHDRKRPIKVKAIEFRRCKLTSNGSLDSAFKDRRKAMCAELASIRLRKECSPKVIDASFRFKERRFHNEYCWTPTVTLVQKLSAGIQAKAEGVLESREIMYQILHLTATA